MNRTDVLAIITTSSLFAGLTDAALAELLATGRSVTVAPGDHFFHQGADATRMYLILSGRVKLSQVTAEGNQVIVNYFGPGNGLGMIVALSDMEYPLSAVAIEPCAALVWERETMIRLMERFPRLALNGMQMIGRRFAGLQKRFQELSTERVEQRVARAVLRLARQFGERTPEGLLLKMPLTREDLAQMTGTNLYNVSRILSKWEQLGYIHSERQRLTLLKAHELVIIAEDLPRASS